MPTSPSFVFRFDAGARQGAGHFMRQLAIAEQASQRGPAVMLVPNDAAVLAGEIPDEVEIKTLPELEPESELVWLREHTSASDLCFVDSYTLPVSFYEQLNTERLVVAFEDGERDLPARVVVKPRPRRGNRKGSPRTLEGFEFVPVRSAFRSPHSPTKPPTGKRRLVITFGASDPTAATAKILSGLPPALAQSWCLSVVRGPLACPELISAATSSSLSAAGWDVEFHQSPNMAPLLASADAAICAAGSVVWELATLAVPTLAFAVVPNQVRNESVLRELGCIAGLDQLDKFLRNAGFRADLAGKLHAAVDGQGASRIVDEVIARLK